MYTVYLDVLIIENLLINFVILHITSKLLCIKTPWYRLLVSSFVGCVYCILTLIIKALITSILLKILLSSIMIFIAFHIYSIKHFFELATVFYIVTFAFVESH